MQVFLSSIFLASIAALVRNFLDNSPPTELFLRKTLGKLSGVITCGFCFSYWLALLFSLFFTVIDIQSVLGLRAGFFPFLFQWFILGLLTAVFRSIHLTLQEIVSYFVHHLNAEQHRGHHHHDNDMPV